MSGVDPRDRSVFSAEAPCIDLERLREHLQKAADDVLARAKATAPIMTGALRSSLGAPLHGPPAPPTFGPELPSLADQYRWAGRQVDALDLDPSLADLLHSALGDAIAYDEDW